MNKLYNAVDIIRLNKSYRMGKLTIPVLKDINLSFKKGEFISIMGPSGSGKSTLLYLIGGLDDPSSGTISIKGMNLTVMNDKQKSVMRRRTIGFVFQFYNLVPNLNVEENIMLPVLLDGKNPKKYKNDLDEIIEIVGLAERRKHTPNELSCDNNSGCYSKALINKPEIILLMNQLETLIPKQEQK